jgi:chitin disaccharide deacetylase
LNHLVITADDFGLNPDVNEAVEMAHRSGILSAASLMVAGPAAADAIRRARRLPRLRIGLHLALVDASPALSPEVIPLIVDGRGRLREDIVRFGFAIAIRPTARAQLVKEIAAQFHAYRMTGLALDHVNAHRHFHLHPLVAGTVIELAKRNGSPALRVPVEPISIVRRVDPGGGRKASAAWPLPMLLRAYAKRRRLIVPDAVFGIAWSGAMTKTRLLSLLKHVPPGLVEIYCHPAVSNNFAGSASGYRYTEEFAALTDPNCSEALRQSGRTLGGYADIVS